MLRDKAKKHNDDFSSFSLKKRSIGTLYFFVAFILIKLLHCFYLYSLSFFNLTNRCKWYVSEINDSSLKKAFSSFFLLFFSNRFSGHYFFEPCSISFSSLLSFVKGWKRGNEEEWSNYCLTQIEYPWSKFSEKGQKRLFKILFSDPFISSLYEHREICPTTYRNSAVKKMLASKKLVSWATNKFFEEIRFFSSCGRWH